MKRSKKEDRRDKILEAAITVFAKNGYHSTSISDVCKQADIARGTVYLYFQNKRDLFDTLIKNFILTIFKSVNIFTPDKNPVDQFNENIRGIVKNIFSNRKLIKIVVSEAVGLDKEFDHQLILFYAKLTEYIEGALTMLLKSGRIEGNLNVRMLTYAIIGTIKEITYQSVIGESSMLNMDSLIEQLKKFSIEDFISFKEQSKC